MKKQVRRLAAKLIGNQSLQGRYKNLQKECSMLQMSPNQLDKNIIIPLTNIIIGSEANGKDKAVAHTNKHFTTLSYF